MKKLTIAVLGVLLLGIFMMGCDKENYAESKLKEYTKAWGESNFSNMYKIIDKNSKGKVQETDFVQRYKNIYNGIGAKNIKIDIDYTKMQEKDKKNVEVPFKLTMTTVAGELKLDGKVGITKEEGDKKDWKVLWTPSLIIPGIENDDKIKITTLKGERGEIKDRNDNGLAINGTVAEVGIVPGKLGSDAENSKKSISDLLGISSDSINKKLSAKNVKPDMFVSVKLISNDAEDLKQKLLAIPGVKINDKKARVYPMKEKAAHLVGYVQNVTADDIKKNTEWTYKDGDAIGKAGLEAIYEKNLRAQNGYELYIADSKNNKKKTLLKTDAKNGETIKLTIDSNAQNVLFDQFNGDATTGVAMNPTSGEVLAMVSTPSYDPNNFVLGMSDALWKQLNEDSKKPLLNRFQGTFCPGSSFKPITAAIGLETSKLDANATKSISGLKWQKSNAWGGYWVTRVEEYSAPSNLQNALIYSDNIYFAQTAIDIGKDAFQESLKKFGFGEKMPFEYGLTASQFDSDGNIKEEVQLADSGYGQGQLLINPLHLASMYSTFVNKGSMIKPYLKLKDNATPEMWKSNVMSEANASLIAGDLRQVVANPAGTGHAADIKGMSIAGKTGTAEIKLSQTDETGTELGWFTAFNVDNPNLLITAMVEDVKGRGGSHYVVPKVKTAYENIK